METQVWGYSIMFKFFKNVAREMRKVSWPKRQELTRYTITVLTTVAFVAVFFAIVDLGISQVLELISQE
jgi:preprotein translocase subunit SecE